jgi:hypothetical protein
VNGELIDLLGAMGDYFEARREESKARDDHHASGEATWDYWGADYIERVEKAYKRVEEEWAKVFASV